MYYNSNSYCLLNIFHVPCSVSKHFSNGNDVNNNKPLLHASNVPSTILTPLYVLAHRTNRVRLVSLPTHFTDENTEAKQLAQTQACPSPNSGFLNMEVWVPRGSLGLITAHRPVIGPHCAPPNFDSVANI